MKLKTLEIPLLVIAKAILIGVMCMAYHTRNYTALLAITICVTLYDGMMAWLRIMTIHNLFEANDARARKLEQNDPKQDKVVIKQETPPIIEREYIRHFELVCHVDKSLATRGKSVYDKLPTDMQENIVFILTAIATDIIIDKNKDISHLSWMLYTKDNDIRNLLITNSVISLTFGGMFVEISFKLDMVMAKMVFLGTYKEYVGSESIDKTYSIERLREFIEPGKKIVQTHPDSTGKITRPYLHEHNSDTTKNQGSIQP